VLVKVNSDEHAQYTDNVDFDAEAHGEFQQDQVERERGINAGRKVGGEDILNHALGRNDVENFSKNPAKQPPDHDKDEQNPG
jgi:hypothetical protein